MPEAPTRPLASSANCLFHASKPAAVLPHCAASALPPIHASAAIAATVIALNCPPLFIRNSFPQTKRGPSLPTQAPLKIHTHLSKLGRAGQPGTAKARAEG